MIYTYIVKIKIQAKEVYLTLSVGLRIGVRCMRFVFFCLAGKHISCLYANINHIIIIIMIIIVIIVGTKSFIAK